MTTRSTLTLVFAVAMVVVGAVFYRSLVPPDSPSGSLASLSTAAELPIFDKAGRKVDLAKEKGRIVVIHFWATWCSVCRAEQGSIAAIAHDDPNVITVAMQSGTAEEVSRHMHEQGIDFPVVNDQDGMISRAWGVHAVPASFIIAPDGRIRFIEVGYSTGIGLRLRLWLARI